MTRLGVSNTEWTNFRIIYIFVLRLYNLHVLYCIPGSPNAYYMFFCGVRFELVKNPEVTLCGWWGYKLSITNSSWSLRDDGPIACAIDCGWLGCPAETAAVKNRLLKYNYTERYSLGVHS